MLICKWFDKKYEILFSTFLISDHWSYRVFWQHFKISWIDYLYIRSNWFGFVENLILFESANDLLCSFRNLCWWLLFSTSHDKCTINISSALVWCSFAFRQVINDGKKHVKIFLALIKRKVDLCLSSFVRIHYLCPH
jgi:hypothetical protein